MVRFDSPLDRVRIAAPCPANWDEMLGSYRVRFCSRCELNVYNLSSMTRAEAEAFIAGHEGKLCVRFYQRADGSILTQNCPVGVHQAVGSTGLNATHTTPRGAVPLMGEVALTPTPVAAPAFQPPAGEFASDAVRGSYAKRSRRKNGHAS
jgi:hypothetical protein